ncbi:89948c04-5def-4a66-91b1-1d09f37fd2a1 [Thermothielavioides terrestris]|uniref:89948c04-5def-4a66-91b1-1d09f37fd2a1 n=1 Tax=Thermothielavioides terrestris TaxID=2587410 RepID=A0A3S4EWJ2_9PEZI|nr:89948c04-5def-4a66-91b1-1d09f37fd2a1 [Thermothielavioides terrestris]
MSVATASPAQGGLSIPALAEPSDSDPGTGDATPRAAADGEEKKKKRSLFGFGKKKTEEPAKPPAKPAPTSKPAPTTSRATPAAPIQTDHARFSPSSPGRPGFASSPRLASPADRELHPPVLDASSEAITADNLDPDDVEIITHTSHQPASIAVTGGIGLSPYEPSWTDELAAFSAQRTTNTTTSATAADTASNYGSFDTTDVRRLSFISFADVVQAEHAGQFAGPAAGSRDSMHMAGLTSLAALGAVNNHNRNRSPSPIRSPVSSSGGGAAFTGGSSPPTSNPGSVKGLEISGGTGAGGVMAGSASPRSASSPVRRPLGSPASLVSMQHLSGGGPTVSGEIAIETMTQALRRTGSGDLSGGGGSVGVRSFPASPI